MNNIAKFLPFPTNFHIALIELRTTASGAWLDAKTGRREGLKRGEPDVGVLREGKGRG